MSQRRRSSQAIFLLVSCVITFFFYLFLSRLQQLSAIPAFARKYQSACSTCHNDPPELNDFGWAFKKNGFKFPKAEISA